MFRIATLIFQLVIDIQNNDSCQNIQSSEKHQLSVGSVFKLWVQQSIHRNKVKTKTRPAGKLMIIKPNHLISQLILENASQSQIVDEAFCSKCSRLSRRYQRWWLIKSFPPQLSKKWQFDLSSFCKEWWILYKYDCGVKFSLSSFRNTCHQGR